MLVAREQNVNRANRWFQTPEVDTLRRTHCTTTSVATRKNPSSEPPRGCACVRTKTRCEQSATSGPRPTRWRWSRGNILWMRRHHAADGRTSGTLGFVSSSRTPWKMTCILVSYVRKHQRTLVALVENARNSHGKKCPKYLAHNNPLCTVVYLGPRHSEFSHR